MRGLIDGGVRPAAARDDLRHAERQGRHRRDRGTCSRRRGVRLPLMISVTITDRSGRTLSGQTLDAFYMSIAHAQPFSVGINCALGARDMRPYLAELARHRRVLRQLLSERRPAERVRRVRRAARRDRRRCCSEFADQRLRQHRRRLLRHDAGSHRGDRQGRRRGASPPTADPSRIRRACVRAPAITEQLHAVLRPRDADDPARQQLPDDRRADQRHRLGAVRAADQGRRTTPRRPRWRSSRCAAAPTSSTSTWTKACSTPSRR